MLFQFCNSQYIYISEIIAIANKNMITAQATPADLAEVARAALAATGDGQGIRVRIYRKKDATAGAKLDLFSKLNDAGVPSEAIQDMKEFLD